MELVRRCPLCDAPVLVTEDGRMVNDGRHARGEEHECKP